MFIEKNIPSNVIKEINLLVTSNYFEDRSGKTCTQYGHQTPNIINLFDENLLKKILPIKNYYKEIFHIHYIDYLWGGYQDEHHHEKTEKYSFILYLNDSDGKTFFKKPINKKISPKKGKLIFFDSNILHGGEKSFKGKRVLVGAVNKAEGLPSRARAYEASKNKKIFFLAGFPRAGNTLLTSILNQNPDIGCTPNSIVLEIYKEVWLLKQIDVFKNYPDHRSLDNVLDMVYPTYYRDWNYKYIIDRGPAGTQSNLTLLKKHLKQEIKIIFLVRPLLEVLASWVTWSLKTPDSFIRQYTKNPTEACHWLMKDDNQIMREMKCMQNLLKPENKHHVHFVDFKEIVEKPVATLKGIYQFLGIPPFKHRFINLDQVMVNGLSYDDTILGKGVHTIKTKKLIKSKTDVNILPPEIIKQYGKIKFV